MAESALPGLSPAKIEEWFKLHLPPGTWESARVMERAESWVPGEPDGVLASLLQVLMNYIEENPDQAGILVEDEQIADFIHVLAYTKSSPFFRLLGLMGQCQPGLGGDVLKACEGGKSEGHPMEAESKVILGRIKVLVRYECYSRVFGPERRKEILRILDELNETGGQA